MSLDFESVRSPDGLPSNCKNVPGGFIVGGALVPEEECACNCGYSAAVDLGDITVDYDDGIESFNHTFTFVNPMDIIDGSETLDADEYTAFMVWTEAEDGCVPSGYVLCDAPYTGADYSMGYVRLNASGVGELGIADWANPDGFGNLNNFDTLDRAGIVYGAFEGDYTDPDGDCTLPVDKFVQFRSGDITSSFQSIIDTYNDIPS